MVLTPEQGNQKLHDPDTAISATEEKDKDEESQPGDVYMFTHEAKNQLLQEIRSLIIRATHTKVTDIMVATHQSSKTELPKWVQDYKEVFELEGFQELLPRRPWDHTINLKEGTRPWTRTCIILLSTEEQKTLQDFLEENLKTRRIQPSKSPYTSPFFFMKKKDRKL